MSARTKRAAGRLLPIFAVLAALAVCGCSERKAPEDIPEDVSTKPEPAPRPRHEQPPVVEKPAPAKLPDAPAIPSDQQMLDDADATGLTATLPAEEDTGSADASNAQ